jgi:hypothetical protein
MHKHKLCILNIVLIVGIFLLGLYYFKNTEEFNRIRFLDRTSTIHFFETDKDGYIEQLTEYDILAQKSKTKNEYKNKIINSASNFTDDEKRRLTLACQKADNALLKINIPGFDGKKASQLNWNLALTRGRQYEDGLPHTRLDTIFLTDRVLNDSEKQMAKTMLHEKVHVYERMFPEDIDIWLKTNGYKKFKKWSSFENARSNPDINEWSYLRPDGKPMVVLYNKNIPESIHDVDYPKYEDPSSEHPYETLAYMLEQYL